MRVIDVKAGIEDSGNDTFKMPHTRQTYNTSRHITVNIRMNRCMTSKMVGFYERNKAVAIRELVKLFGKYKVKPYRPLELEPDYKMFPVTTMWLDQLP